MHDIADNLTDQKLGELVVGSDEEASFKAAISRCFVGSTHVLCTRHLKQNENKQLEDKVGYPLKDRQAVQSKIFGSDGFTVSKDIDSFNARLSTVRQIIDDNDSKVGERKF